MPHQVKSEMVNFKHNNSKFFYFGIVLVIFISGSWIVDAGSGSTKAALYLLTFFWALAYLQVKKRITISATQKKNMLLLLASFALVSTLNGGGLQIDEVNLLFKITTAGILAVIFSYYSHSFYEHFSRVIYFTTIVGLIFHLFVVISPDLVIPIPDFLYQSNNKFVSFLYYNYYQPGSFSRNQLFFWEPGCYSFFLNIALIFDLFICVNYRRIPVLLAGIISTLSLGGFFIAILIFIAKYASRRNKYKILFVSALAVFVIFNNLLIKFASSISSILFSRPLGADESFLTRMVDVYLPIQAASASPFVGFGLNKIDAFLTLGQETNLTSQNIITNSISMLIYSYGFMIALLFLALLYRSTFLKATGSRIMIFPIFILMLMHEPLLFSPFVLLLILMPDIAEINQQANYYRQSRKI